MKKCGIGDINLWCPRKCQILSFWHRNVLTVIILYRLTIPFSQVSQNDVEMIVSPADKGEEIRDVILSLSLSNDLEVPVGCNDG